MGNKREKEIAADLQNTKHILEYARFSYQLRLDNFDKLDSKAATMAGFIGIVIAISSTVIGSKVLLAPNLSPYTQTFSVFLFASTMLMLFTAFAFCLLALKARPNCNPTNIEGIIRNYRAMGKLIKREKQLLKDLVNTIKLAENNRMANNQTKSSHLQTATNYLFVALGCAIFCYIVNAFFLLTKT